MGEEMIVVRSPGDGLPAPVRATEPAPLGGCFGGILVMLAVQALFIIGEGRLPAFPPAYFDVLAWLLDQAWLPA
jgi:hypothetical protein